MEQILTVLAGQPNCGKSTIFNMLTGARQYVANYPGVTVEKKAGSFVHGDTRVELVDLPGTYSLASWSPEEMAARQFIVEEDPAQIVAVLDASTLEKSLYLCLQLLEMRRPTLAVLNMMDVAAKRGIRVDADALSRALGIPVIQTQASKGIGKQELYSAITARHGRSGSAEIVDYGELETDIREITRLLPRQGVKGYPSRWFAIKLLEQDSKHLDRIQVLMASSREFYILVRLQGKKESDVFSYLSRIEKSIKDNGFTVRRATEQDLKRMLGVYFEQNVTTERYEDHDGERWVLFGE